MTFNPGLTSLDLQELLVSRSSVEQLEARVKASQEEKEELEKRLKSLRTEFDLEKKARQEFGAKNSELDSESKMPFGCGWSGRGKNESV